jgi:hypothetical protein
MMTLAKLKIEQILEDPQTLKVTSESGSQLIVSDFYLQSVREPAPNRKFNLADEFDRIVAGDSITDDVTRHQQAVTEIKNALRPSLNRRELCGVLVLPHDSFDLIVDGESGESTRAFNPISSRLKNYLRVVVHIANLRHVHTAQITLEDDRIGSKDLSVAFLDLRIRNLQFELVLGLTPRSYDLKTGHWQRG